MSQHKDLIDWMLEVWLTTHFEEGISKRRHMVMMLPPVAVAYGGPFDEPAAIASKGVMRSVLLSVLKKRTER